MARNTQATAAALLLLPLFSGLLRFARGAFLLHGDEVSANRAIEVVREKSEKIQAWALTIGELPSDPAGAIAVERPVRDETDHYVAGDKIASLSSLFQPSTSQKRDLQESNCADSTSPIYVTSTVFSLLEGCMTPVDIGGEVSYTLDTAFIFRGERSSSTDATRWYVVTIGSTDDMLTTVCVSVDSADDVHPSEATWYCDLDGGGSVFTLADDELDITCGCEIPSPSPIYVASDPLPTTLAPFPSAAPTCGKGDSFSIESEFFPEAEGCFVDTAVMSNDRPVYTISGTVDQGQVVVLALELTEDDPSSIHWVIADTADSSSTEDTRIYCISLAQATLYHPSDVPLWECDSEGTISVDCGCSSSSSYVTPAPVLSPTSQPAALTSSPVASTLVPATTSQPAVATVSPGERSPTITPEIPTISPVVPSPNTRPEILTTSPVILSPTPPSAQPPVSTTTPVTFSPVPTPTAKPGASTESPVEFLSMSPTGQTTASSTRGRIATLTPSSASPISYSGESTVSPAVLITTPPTAQPTTSPTPGTIATLAPSSASPTAQPWVSTTLPVVPSPASPITQVTGSPLTGAMFTLQPTLGSPSAQPAASPLSPAVLSPLSPSAPLPASTISPVVHSSISPSVHTAELSVSPVAPSPTSSTVPPAVSTLSPVVQSPSTHPKVSSTSPVVRSSISPNSQPAAINVSPAAPSSTSPMAPPARVATMPDTPSPSSPTTQSTLTTLSPQVLYPTTRQGLPIESPVVLSPTSPVALSPTSPTTRPAAAPLSRQIATLRPSSISPSAQPAVSTIAPLALNRGAQPVASPTSPADGPAVPIISPVASSPTTPTALPAMSTISPMASPPVLPTIQPPVSAVYVVSPSPTWSSVEAELSTTSPIILSSSSPAAQPAVSTISPNVPSPTSLTISPPVSSIPQTTETLSPTSRSPTQPATTPISRGMATAVPSSSPTESRGGFSTMSPTQRLVVGRALTSSPTTAYGTFTASPTDVNEGMPIANATSTCSGDGSFAITSNTAPELDGCYVDTGATDVGGSILYTVSGTTTMAEIYVFSRQYDDGNFYWNIANRTMIVDSSQETTLYCSSEEPAREVNPGDASWLCDFDGDGETNLATEDDISLICGSCTTTVVEDTSIASKLAVGVVIAGCAGVAAIASACSGW